MRSPIFLPGAQFSPGSQRLWHSASPRGGPGRGRTPPDVHSGSTMPYLRALACSQGCTGPSKIGRGMPLQDARIALSCWRSWPILPLSDQKERCLAKVRTGLAQLLQFYVCGLAQAFTEYDAARTGIAGMRIPRRRVVPAGAPSPRSAVPRLGLGRGLRVAVDSEVLCGQPVPVPVLDRRLEQGSDPCRGQIEGSPRPCIDRGLHPPRYLNG